MDMKINILNLGQHATITKDGVKLTIDASIAYRITNPIISFYILGIFLFRKVLIRIGLYVNLPYPVLGRLLGIILWIRYLVLGWILPIRPNKQS